MGDKIATCYVRQPVHGKLVSNVHQGGSATEIPLDKIPPEIIEFYHQVHNEVIKKYPFPMYNMDMGVGKHGIKLIELNSNTAFPDNNFKGIDFFVESLIEHLESIQKK